ncbi:MAG: response regulator, partial [Deltaproteobacteria bacterium]|nr:response regulator [Deltaproteobacteria bacterium]
LVEMMGGEIGVISEEGAGSEFWFTARFSRQDREEEVDATPFVDLHGVKALIVDDNAVNREILSARMSSWGMRPVEGSDGESAMDALRKAADEGDPFRVAMIDMHMPGMDGESLGRMIKEDKRLSDTLLVMLTSIGVRGYARRFQDAGFAAYLIKPARHQELFNVLREVINASSGAGDKTQAEQMRPIITRHSAPNRLRVPEAGEARVLLVEDNITNQQVALGILKNLGVHADAVADGAEAVRVLKTIPYDLVLMDIQMPVMDGLEATRQIRKNKEETLNINVPIIAMTAHAMKGDLEKCLEAGMNDYMSKPVSAKPLAEKLDKWLALKPVAKGKDAEGEKGGKSGRKKLPVFDFKAMIGRLMDDRSLAETIIRGFLSDIPVQIETLKRLVESGDVPAVERQAHAIKGAAANVDGHLLRTVAFEIEKAGKAGDLSAVKGLMNELESHFNRLKEEMEKVLKTQ